MAPGRERPRALQVFGNEVKRYRSNAGLSQDQVGAKTHVSGSFIGKIERGECRCERKLAVRLDELLDTKGALPSLWDMLVINAAFPPWFDWPKVEWEAGHIAAYQCLVVDGLLQTEDYARALLGGDEDAVRARMSRQAILTRETPPPPRLTVLLAEAVLHHRIGTKETMRGQLQHLLDISSDQVSVQIVPDPLPSAGTAGAFAIATLADRSEIAYVESAARGLTMSEPDDIRALADTFDALRSQALPVGMSRDLIRKVLEERWT